MSRFRTSRTRAVGQVSPTPQTTSRTESPYRALSESDWWSSESGRVESVRVVPAKARYVVTLEAPDSGDRAIRRLRAFLKLALRGFGLRAIDIRQEQ